LPRRCADLTGKQFGSWTVLEYGGLKRWPSGTARQYWQCRCACGAVAAVGKYHLTNGTSTRCYNCAKRINLVGRSFGKWRVIARGKRKLYWRCRCTCGRIEELSTRTLKSNGRTQCRVCALGKCVGTAVRFKRRRIELGLSLKVLGERLGVTKQRAHQLERLPDKLWTRESRRRVEAALNKRQ
jgi:hypothetical protein